MRLLLTLVPRARGGLLLCTALALASACADPAEGVFTIGGHQYDPQAAVRLKLPRALREISGLALSADDRLYAHNDERGTIYQIDYRKGRVLKRFSLDGKIKDDFEGIAIATDRLYLITSQGTLYETRIGSAEELVPFRRYEAGLPCEVEGLARSADGLTLLAACKNLTDDTRDLVLHRWHPDRQAWSGEIRIPEASWRAMVEADGVMSDTKKVPKRLQPTGLSLTATGNLLLLAGPQRLLLEMSSEGEPLAAAALPRAIHRQPEGLVITRSGQLLIADEGDSKGGNKSRGTLSIYEPHH